MTSSNIIDVFPISASAFGMPTGWFENFAVKMIRPSYLVMILFLVLSVGIMVLKRFENSNLERKLWNIPVIIVLIGVWPSLVHGIKDLIDIFNTFLIRDIFHVQWNSFGFPSLGTVNNILGWSADSLARLLPNLAFWIIYAFYFLFFFFFAVLGPFVLAKGVLFDEIEVLLELIAEITLLFLWQTTVVILVCVVLPEIVSGDSITSYSGGNVYFRSFILGIIMFFVPSITRKFGNHLGTSMFTPGLTRSLGFLTLGSAWGLGAKSIALASGTKAFGDGVQKMTHKVLNVEDIAHRYMSSRKIADLENKVLELKSEEEIEEHQYQLAADKNLNLRTKLHAPHHSNGSRFNGFGRPKNKNENDLVNLSKKAKIERDEV